MGYIGRVYDLVSSACHSKTTIDWVAYTTQIYFVTVVEAVSPKVRVPAWLGSGEETHSWLADGYLFAVSSCG